MTNLVSVLYRIFLKGLITLLPITITLYLLIWIAKNADAMFGEPMRTWLPEAIYFRGLGVVLALLIIFAVGFLVNNYVTRQLFAWVEERFENLPVVRSIYGPLRDVTQLFAEKDNSSTRQRVVLVRLSGTKEKPGTEVLGLVTRDQFDDLPEGTVDPDSLAVFVPFSYGMGGFTVIVPRSDARETALPADKAMQLALTGWIKAHK